MPEVPSGLLSGRGVGDEFDLFDGIRGDLLEELVSWHIAGFPIDEELYVFISAQAEISIWVYLYGGQVVHQLSCIASGGCEVFADADDFPVGFLYDGAAFCAHIHVEELLGIGHEGKFSQVDMLVFRCDTELPPHALIAYKADF